MREEPLLLNIHGKQLLTMRTPGQDEDLALGFLLGEGLLDSADDLLQLFNQDDDWDVVHYSGHGSANHEILLEVDDPPSVARKVNRRLEPGTVSVPRGVDGSVRVHVGDPRDNERLFQTLREVLTARRKRA